MPPVAAQTDAEQKVFKMHGLERKGGEHGREEEKYILSDVVVECECAHRLLDLKGLPTALAWNNILPRTCAQAEMCLALQRGLETACTPKHIAVRKWECWIAISPGWAATGAGR